MIMNLFDLLGGIPEPKPEKTAADFDTSDTPLYCSHGHTLKIVDGPMGMRFYELTFIGHNWQGEDHDERALVSLRFPVNQAVDLAFGMIDGIGRLDAGSILVGTMQFTEGIRERVNGPVPQAQMPDVKVVPLDEDQVRRLFMGGKLDGGDDDPQTGQYL